MRPLSLRLPKALLPFCGRPLLEYALEVLLQHGVRNVVVVAGRCDQDFEQFESWGKERGISVGIARRGLEHGSAGVVRDVARERLARTEDILVIYGDSLISLDVGGLVSAHKACKAAACGVTIAYHTPCDLVVPGKPHTNYGILWVDSDRRVVRFVEKPAVEQLTSRYANAGVFVLSQNVFECFSEARPLDFAGGVFEQLVGAQGTQVYAFDIGSGYRFDIGTVLDYWEKQIAVLRGEIVLDGVPWSLVRGSASLRGTSHVEGRAMIGRDCRIQDRVALVGYNVIGSRVSIGADSVISNSVVLDDTTIGESVRVTDAVIGASCRVGDRAVLRRGSILGDFSVLRSGDDQDAVGR
jgi:NDP-sugar pyrophosphorylase family protein